MSDDTTIISLDNYISEPEEGEVPEILTQKQENFCFEYIANGGNMSEAYRAAYNPAPSTSIHTISKEASKVFSRPKVKRRIHTLLSETEVNQRATIKSIIQDWIDMASADTNELVSAQRNCCRYCHGIDGEYQWADGDEYADAVELAKAKAQVSGGEPEYPSDKGGYGFDFTKDPNPDCKKCRGEGILRHVVQDTRKLSPQAKKLYKGSKVNRQGNIEILMHDPQEARKCLARVFAVFQDTVNVNTADGKVSFKGVTAIEAAKAYEELMGKK